MPLDEAARQADILLRDPTSMLHAAVSEWRFPMTREGFALLDVYDLLMQVNIDKKAKFEPHPGRPFDMPDERTITRRGNAAGRTREQVVAILAAHGHGVN